MATYGFPDINFVLIDGYDLTPYTDELGDTANELLLEDGTAAGQSWQVQYSTGVRKAGFKLKGFYNDAMLGSNAALVGPVTTARVMCYGVENNVIGRHVSGFRGAFEGKFNRLPVRHLLTKFEADFDGSGQYDEARILLPYSTVSAGVQAAYLHQETPAAVALTSGTVASPAVFLAASPHRLAVGSTVVIAGTTGGSSTADGNWIVAAAGFDATHFSVTDASGAALNNSGTAYAGGTVQQTSSGNGGVAYLQLNAIVLGDRTSLTAKVQHSVDNVTFVDLAWFTGLTTAPQAPPPVVVAAGATVYGYLRASVLAVGGTTGELLRGLLAFARLL